MEPQFCIENTICKPGKISNNLEMHGEEEVVVFAIPVEGAMVNADTANAIAGDPYFSRSVFNDNKGFLEPMPWVRKPISFPEKYENAVARIRFHDEEIEFKAARIANIELTPTAGGLFACDYQLQIRPELDRANLLLQEYQHHEVTVTIADAAIAKKKSSKQSNLALVGGGAKYDEDAEGEEDGSELDGTADAAREQIRQANETERQLGEALRGLEQQPATGTDG